MSRPSRAERLQQIQSRMTTRAGVRAAVEPQAPSSDAKSAELWLYGVVGGYWFGFNAKSVADQLRGLDVDQLTVRLHSPGGSALDGIAIGNLLRNHKARVTVVVDGFAASSASIIAIAGDEIVMSPGSQLMIHDPWLMTVGNAAELRQDADFLDKQAANMAGIYTHRAGGTDDEWRAAMTAAPDGTWYTAQEAVDANLADRVGTVTAVSAAPEPPVDEALDDGEMDARAAWDLEVLVHPAARAAWQASAVTPKPPTASADGSTHTEGGSAVAFSDEQLTTMRGTLGLPESADETAILAAINAVVEESLEERSATATPQIPDGMALVDSAVLQELRDGATAGRTAQATLANQERDRAITQALKDGKIAATSREKFVEAWDKDPATTAAILDTLTPGLVPTTEAGHESEPSALGEGLDIDDAELEAFAASLGLSKEALRG